MVPSLPLPLRPGRSNQLTASSTVVTHTRPWSPSPPAHGSLSVLGVTESLSVPSPVYKILGPKGLPKTGKPISSAPPHLSHLHILQASIYAKGQGRFGHPDEPSLCHRSSGQQSTAETWSKVHTRERYEGVGVRAQGTLMALDKTPMSSAPGPSRFGKPYNLSRSTVRDPESK